MNKIVSWLSGGISSFIAAWLVRDQLTDVIFIDIDDQTRDTLRFAQEAAKFLGKPLVVLRSPYYRGKNDVIRARRYINGPNGAPCTCLLKKTVRASWEAEHAGDALTYVWGFDANEQGRITRTAENNPQARHLFPLAERDIGKAQAHAICRDLGLRRADMYDLGYPNANCVGCVKGGMGYWNKVRVDFPEAFAEMEALEREIGATCLHDENGKVWLDELDPQRGRCDRIVIPPCGIACGVLERWEQQEIEGFERTPEAGRRRGR
jgi:hypothetical protein